MARSNPNDPIADLLADFRQATPVRTGSLIVTLFGDLIAPRGGNVTLASLLPLLRYIGVNDSQARTAVSRLVADGWLARRNSNGRRGIYGISENGRPLFEEAERRIYHEPTTKWDSLWHVAIISSGAGAAHDALRKELGWIGFGSISSSTLIHPNPDTAALAAILVAFSDRIRPLVVAGRDVAGIPNKDLHELARDCWKLDKLGAAHESFVENFEPLRRFLASGGMPDGLAAVAGSTLLIHAFRRVVLRDPQLPESLLPEDWPGRKSRALVGEVYRLLEPIVADWSLAHLAGPNATLPAPGHKKLRRFKAS